MNINTSRLKLEIKRSRRPFAIYVLLVVGGLAATFGILRNQTFQRPWEDHEVVHVAVADAKGLVPGKQEVRIAGVKVGVISKVKLDGDQPIVTLSLEKKYGPVYRDARIRIRPVTPLEDMYVDLRRGTPQAGRLGSSDVIGEEQSITPVDVSRVLDTFDADTRARLATLLHQLGPALKDNGTQLRAALVQAAPFLHAAGRATQVFAERRAELRRLVTNFGRLTDTLAAHDDELTRLVDNGDQTLGALAQSDRPLARTLAGLPGMLTALDRAVTQLGATRTDLDPALEALRPAARNLESGLNALETLGHDATPAFAALNRPVGALTPLARTLRPTADRLADALAALDPQAPALDRITQQIVPCEESLRQFFSNTPSVGKFANGYGAFPRGDVSVDAGTLGANSAHGLTKTPNCTDHPSGGR